MNIQIRIISIIFLTAVTSCNNIKSSQDQKQIPLVGTWELISATTIIGDSVKHKNLSNKKMIKIINESHFAFLNHDINKEKDSLKYFVSGGGKYQLSGNQYVEFLEYCNARVWEGNKFEFKIEIRKDTLIQKGIEKIEELGINQEITEVYIKSKEIEL